MKEILNYQIQILSDWHIGSGLDSATDTDALVLKDEKGLPYIPGKTIKGLIKDAMMDLVEVGKCDQTVVHKVFGNMKKEKEGTKIESRISTAGAAFFTNAIIPKKECKEIIEQELQEFLYRNIASTAIDTNGIAKEKSLRVQQVCVPILLKGEIHQIEEASNNLESAEIAFLKDALKLIRHLGVNRNRGLGRCKFIS